MNQISLEEIHSINKIDEKPLLGIIYGSKKVNSDLDIFLLYSSYVEKNIFKNNYDLNQIDKKNFLYKIYNRDIEYTEPILTGEYFTGDKKLLYDLKDFLLNEKPNKNIFDYLNKRVIETYLQAQNYYSYGKNQLFIDLVKMQKNSNEIKSIFFGKNEFTSEILNKSLSILSYSFSYLSSIFRYKNGYNFVTINDLMKEPINDIEKNFSDLRKYFKDCSTGKQLLSFEEVDLYFELGKNLIRREI